VKIAVYRSAVPAKTKNQFKRDLLTAFARGAAVSGDEVQIVDSHDVAPADVAVLQGWIGMKAAPHLTLRSQVIDAQHQANKHTGIIDSNLYGFLAPEDFNRYLRYSLDGIFPTTGWYFDNKLDNTRWPKIKQSYRFKEHPWRKSQWWGANQGCVLICLQRDGGWSMDGYSVKDWLSKIIPKIQSHTNRPIVIRAHPGSVRIVPEVKELWPNVAISELADIRQDLDRAWCTVTYNSSPGVVSTLWGVPTFVTDPNPERSQAWPYCNTDLSQIEKPATPDREEFYHRLAQCHFSMEELRSGQAWQFMRERFPQR